MIQLDCVTGLNCTVVVLCLMYIVVIVFTVIVLSYFIITALLWLLFIVSLFLSYTTYSFCIGIVDLLIDGPLLLTSGRNNLTGWLEIHVLAPRLMA